MYASLGRVGGAIRRTGTALLFSASLWAAAGSYEKALSLLRSGQAVEAIPYLESAHAGEPNSADVLYTLAQTYFALGRTAEGTAALSNLARRHSEDPAVLTAAGSLLLSKSLTEPAVQILEQAARVDSANPMLLQLLAKAQLGSNRREASAATLRTLLTNLRRTSAEETRASLQGALATANAIHSVNPESISGAMLAAEFSFLLNRFVDVIQILEPLRSKAGEDAGYFNLLAASFAGLSDFRKAIGAAKRALEIAPLRQDLILNLAGIYQKARDNESAIRLLQKTISEGAATREIYFALGLSQFNFGSYSDAVVSCNRALAVDSGFDRALLLRGRAQARMARREDSIASFREAIRVNPACDYCRYELAEQLAGTNAAGEAESLLRQVVGRAPSYAAAQYLLGKLLAARGESRAAIAALEAAVASDPNNESAWYQLGKQYAEAVDPVKAKSAFDEVRRIKELRRSAAEARLPKSAPVP